MVIKGKVDDWRIGRQQTWTILCGFVGSKELPEPHYLYSLPFDDEIVEQDKKEVDNSLEEWYKLASQDLINFTWPSKN